MRKRCCIYVYIRLTLKLGEIKNWFEIFKYSCKDYSYIVIDILNIRALKMQYIEISSTMLIELILIRSNKQWILLK